MLWLYDANRALTVALPEYESIVETQKFCDHSTWAGRFGLDAYDALMAASFATIDGGDTAYLVERVTIVSDGLTRSVEASGREASALLAGRVMVMSRVWSAKAPGLIVSDIIGSLGGTPAAWAMSDPALWVDGYYTNSCFRNSHRTGVICQSYKANVTTGAGAIASVTMQVPKTGSITIAGSLWRHEASNDTAQIFTGVKGGGIPESPITWTVRQAIAPGGTQTTAINLTVTAANIEYVALNASYPVAATPGLDGDLVRWSGMTISGTTGVTSPAIPGLAFGAGVTLGAAIDLECSWEDIAALIAKVLGAAHLGWRVRLSGTSLLFDVLAPVSTDVLWGDAYGNAVGGQVSSDESGWRNYAIVLGEGAGPVRRRIDVDFTSGAARREVMVDARDIQREQNGVILTDAAYDALLGQRGTEKLAEMRYVEYVEANLIAPASPGDVVWYDSGEYSASLQVMEATTTREGGAVKYGAVLGEPPTTLSRTIQRLR